MPHDDILNWHPVFISSSVFDMEHKHLHGSKGTLHLRLHIKGVLILKQALGWGQMLVIMMTSMDGQACDTVHKATTTIIIIMQNLATIHYVIH